MILVAGLNPQRHVREFQRMTLLQIQVKTGGGKVHIGSEQGEVANPATGSDGTLLTDANTGMTGVVPPYQMLWKGELWYSAEVASTFFTVIQVGEMDQPQIDNQKIADAFAKALDKKQVDGLPGK